MTKICTCCGKPKKGNETKHMLTFDNNITLCLPRSVFQEPENVGNTYNVKRLTVETTCDEEIKIVLKWSRPQHLCDPISHFRASNAACGHAIRVISAFRDTFGIDWDISIVKPMLLESADMVVSIEPYVKQIKRFDVVDNAFREVSDILNAMSHFSYIFSKGKYVMTDFKGSVQKNTATILLLPPTLLSNEVGAYGCQDLGSIRKYFFHAHICNSLCEDMKMPRNRHLGHDSDDEIVFTPLNGNKSD